MKQLDEYGQLRVSAVQFGTLDRQPMPPLASRAFAFDHEQRFDDGSKKAWLDIHYEHKEIQIHVSILSFCQPRYVEPRTNASIADGQPADGVEEGHHYHEMVKHSFYEHG